MRLIDADVFKDWLLNRFAKPQDTLVLTLQGFIAEQPTAYDIDKVVEELEIRVNEANNNCLCEMHENGHTLDFENENGRIKGLKEAIEIVKQGSVSYDCCEWESDYGFISDKYKRETQCGYKFYDLHHAVAFKYCPYCGKKIKVVE